MTSFLNNLKRLGRSATGSTTRGYAPCQASPEDASPRSTRASSAAGSVDHFDSDGLSERRSGVSEPDPSLQQFALLQTQMASLLERFARLESRLERSLPPPAPSAQDAICALRQSVEYAAKVEAAVEEAARAFLSYADALDEALVQWPREGLLAWEVTAGVNEHASRTQRQVLDDLRSAERQLACVLRDFLRERPELRCHGSVLCEQVARDCDRAAQRCAAHLQAVEVMHQIRRLHGLQSYEHGLGFEPNHQRVDVILRWHP